MAGEAEEVDTEELVEMLGGTNCCSSHNKAHRSIAHSTDDPEAYEFLEYELGPEDAGEPKDEGKVDMDIRMDKLPEPPKGMRGGPGMTSTNTGPKGVKADYEEAKKHMATERFREKLMRERALERKATGAASYGLESGGAGAAAAAAAAQHAAAQKAAEKKKKKVGANWLLSPSMLRSVVTRAHLRSGRFGFGLVRS